MAQGRIGENRRIVESGGDVESRPGKGLADQVDDVLPFVIPDLVDDGKADISPLFFKKRHIEAERIDDASDAASRNYDNWSFEQMRNPGIVQAYDRPDPRVTCPFDDQKVIFFLKIADR